MCIITRKSNSKRFVKKGDVSLVFVVVSLLTVLVLVVLLYPQFNVFNWISGKTSYNVCRISVEDSSLMRVGNIEFSSNLKCQTQEYTVTSDDVDDAKKIVADAMYNCFYQFGQGSLNLFNDEGVFCFVCSTIDFEGDGAKIGVLPEFKKFLFDNKPADARVSYARYLNPSGFKQEKEFLEQSGVWSWPVPAQKSGVIFAYNKTKSVAQKNIEGEIYDLSEKLALGGLISLPLFPISSSLISQAGSLSLSTFIAGKYFGDYSYGGKVFLVQPYSAEKLNSLGCTDRIVQKS